MTVHPLRRSDEALVADVELDPLTRAALEPFDLDPERVTAFRPFLIPDNIPEDFGIGLIVGGSGTGKSLLLRRFGEPSKPVWLPGRTIASHFASAEDAADRFYAVGLTGAPVWRMPYDRLSNGQQFRADLARVIGNDAVVDEFTSVVDRNVAKSASRALSVWVERTGARRLVLASCHRDIEDWLRPDWVIDTDAETLTIGERPDRPWWYEEFVIGEEVSRLVLSLRA